MLNVKLLKLYAWVEAMETVFRCPFKVINNSQAFIVFLGHIHNDSQEREERVFNVKVNVAEDAAVKDDGHNMTPSPVRNIKTITSH